ncbi:MAG TPA: autotransporter domain-containing protein [Lysobacter sp.]|nr:autotransporter domain-containing protein [Lysobacter sp.]
MRKPVRRLLAAALALASAPALAQTYSQTVFFGDSLTDSGFYRPFLVENAGPTAALVGRFTTNPGLVWSEYLANFYGTGAAPAWGLTTTGVVAGTGTNYAAGGATIVVGAGFPPTPPTQFAPSLTTQINTYLATHGGQADANALYTVWGGANDLFFTLNGATTPQQFLGAAGQQVGLVATLQNAGARYILVPTMPDVGTTPFGLSQGPAGSAGITALVDGYNQTLFGGIAQQNLRVVPLDTFHLLREISADLGTYGFSTILPACAGTSLTCVSSGSGSAFADGVHPSTEAHRILGDFAVSVLEAPRQVAVLPNSASMVGRSRAERVAAHAAKPAADGMNWWADVRGDNQRYDEGDLYDGMGPTLTFGVDWSSGNLVYGAFGGYGQQSLDWGHDSGGFDQTDLSIGGFIGWYGEGGGWVNGQLSWSQVDFDTDRKVHLGPAARTHSGSADGENLSAGIRAGWEFGEGKLRHGPVLSVLAQRIDIDGFAENHPELSTSLAYPDQNFDSLIGTVGWAASYDISEQFRPYVHAGVEREFEEYADEAWAQSQSIAGTAAYAVPGLSFDETYGTVTFGARTHLFGANANIGISTTVEQQGGTVASVFVTVGSAF